MTPISLRIVHAALVCLGLLAGTRAPAAAPRDFAPRYERLFIAARAAWEAAPTNSLAASNFTVASFDWADYATNNQHKAEIARLGVASARELIAQAPKLAAPHYYLALNLGQLADATRSLGGLKLVSEMERAFKTAREIDSQFDYAGPDRSLGMLYRDAPGWPISLGSRSKARGHFERACELKPEYPDNQLCLLESWLKWGERVKAQDKLTQAEMALAAARTKFTGEVWAASWADWDRRWRNIQGKAGEPSRATNPPGAGG